MLISEQIPQKILVTKTNLENSRNSWLHYYLAYFPIWSFVTISIYSSIFPFNSLQLSTIAYGTIKICQRRRSVLENKIVDKAEMLCAFTVMMCHCVMCLRNYDSHMNVIIDIRPILEDQRTVEVRWGKTGCPCGCWTLKLGVDLRVVPTAVTTSLSLPSSSTANSDTSYSVPGSRPSTT